MTYIYRFAEERLKQMLSEKEIVVVTGPRQAGKTTLIQHILSNIENTVSYSFDNQNLLREFKQNPDAFYERYMKGKKIVFLDEIQYVKKSGMILKYLFDTYKDVKIVVSGSSAPDIAIQSLKYLVGRVLILEILPFSLLEFINYKKPDIYKLIKEGKDVSMYKKELQYVTSEYMTYGGYPKVVSEFDFEKKKLIIENIYNTLFLREIRDIAGLTESDKLSDLFKSLALMQGSQIDYTKLSKMTGYTFLSIKKYLKLLEQIYVSIRVAPYFKNKLKEISKSPKIYLLDSGLRNYILNDFRGPIDNTRQDIGSILEQVTLRSLNAPISKVYYWRDKSQNEIDFVIEGEALQPIIFECKWKAESFKEKTLEVFAKIHNKPLHQNIIYFDISDGKSNKDSFGVWSVK
jgi:predicted AAA+ superfamily ATPase